MTSDRETRRRRLLKWACLIAGLTIVGAVATGWMLFQHIPAWYTPAQVPAADLQGIKDDLVRSEDSFSASMNAEGIFEFRLTQDRLNAWLAAREQIWPEAQHWIPPMMDAPFIAFEPGRILLAGTVQLGGIQTVLSASVHLGIDDQGVAIRLAGVTGGSLPVPDSLVREQLRQLDARRPRRTEAATSLPSAEELLAGTHVPAEFVWWNGKRPFRVRGIQVERGAITFRIEPLPRRHRGWE